MRRLRERLAAIEPGELEARVSECRGLARWIARRQHAASSTRIDLDDLIQEAMLTLLYAAAYFDPSRGSPLRNIAAVAIKRRLFALVARDFDRPSPLIEADLYRGDDDWTPYAAAGEDDPPDRASLAGDASDGLRRLMERALSERDRLVLEMRHGLFGRPRATRVAVAAVLGVTHQRVAQIEARALRRLRDAADERAPHRHGY